MNERIRTIRLPRDDGDAVIRLPLPPMDAARRADIMDSLRRSVPGIDAVHGLRAARTLEVMRSHPDVVAARSAAMDVGIGSGDTPDDAPAPDPWSARQHDTVAKRTRKGRTTVEVKRRGMAPVVGSVDVVDVPTSDDAVTDRAVMARRLAVDALTAEHVTGPTGRTAYGARRIVCGLSSLDIERVTDRCYGSLGLPVLAGTDAMSWEQVVETPEGVDAGAVRVAVGRSWLTGPASDPTVDALAAPTAVYRAQTRRTYHRVTRSPRRSLPIGRHRSGDVGPRVSAGILRTVSEPYRPPVLAMGLRWHLIAPSATTAARFQGFTLIARPPARDPRSRADRAAATARNERRTVGTVPAPTTAAGWSELLAMLNRGERIRCTTDAGAVTITRNAQRYDARDRRDGREHTYRLRNAARLADALT